MFATVPVHEADAIPRRVNRIVDRLLRLDSIERHGQIDAAILRVVLEELAAGEGVLQSPPEGDRRPFETLLAERDAQIAELHEQLARIEGKVFEQERAIRHTLTTLIEWVEDGTEQGRAA